MWGVDWFAPIPRPTVQDAQGSQNMNVQTFQDMDGETFPIMVRCFWHVIFCGAKISHNGKPTVQQH